MSCLSGYPARGSRVVFFSYKDSAGQIQKFALHFLSIYEAEQFISSVKDILDDSSDAGEPSSNFGSAQSHRMSPIFTPETFEKMVEQLEKIGEPYDRNEVFLQAVGGLDKKNRVYGFGSSQDLFYQSKTRPYISSSIIAEENELLKEELVAVKDRVKAMEDQIAKLIEATSVRVPHLQSPTDLHGQSPTDSEGQDDDDN